ncbi:unnamed protein product [Cochlearia groenlandica]
MATAVESAGSPWPSNVPIKNHDLVSDPESESGEPVTRTDALHVQSRFLWLRVGLSPVKDDSIYTHLFWCVWWNLIVYTGEVVAEAERSRGKIVTVSNVQYLWTALILKPFASKIKSFLLLVA